MLRRGQCIHATSVMAVVAALALAPPTRAADLYWFADGANEGGSGNWSAAGMTWSTTTPAPTLTVWDPNQTAVFQNTAGTVTIADMNIDAAAGMRFETDLYALAGGSLTLTGAAAATNAISVAAGATVTSTAVVAGANGLTKLGAGTFVLAAPNTYGGDTVVDGGTLRFSGSASSAANTIVGYNNGGTVLAIDAGGTVSDLNAYVGLLPSADDGTATVSGAGSTWTTTTDLVVGYQGSINTLTVSDAGAVTTSNGFIGYFATSSTNEVLITEGGSWSNSNVLYVGHDGSDNEFTVEDGATAYSGMDTVVGFTSTSANNTLTVVGMGTEFEIPSPFTLIIGDNGDDNHLSIQFDSVVTGHNARLSRGADASNNSVTVANRAMWINTGTIRVGNLGPDNSVRVAAGGKVSFAGNAFIGHGLAATDNSITIEGSGSMWTGGNMVVGLASTGNTLTVRDQASFMASGVEIAGDPGSAGTVNIGSGALPGTFTAPLQFGDGTGILNFDHNSPAYAFSNAIAGPGEVRHIGTGTTTLSGPSTYTGGTTISAGTLRLAAASAMPAGGPLTLAGGTLDADDYSLTLGALTVAADSRLLFGGGGGAPQTIVFSSAAYVGGTLLVVGMNLNRDALIITADPTGSGILDHIQFAGYPVGALWEPGTGRVLPRSPRFAAPAPALSPLGAALAVLVLAAFAVRALARTRVPDAD